MTPRIWIFWGSSMLFMVNGSQVGPLVNTLIYFKLVKYPTLFKEPWSQDLVVCLAGPDLITYFQLRFTLDFATPKILFGNSSSNFWSSKIEQKSTLKIFKGLGPGQWVSKAIFTCCCCANQQKAQTHFQFFTAWLLRINILSTKTVWFDWKELSVAGIEPKNGSLTKLPS